MKSNKMPYIIYADTKPLIKKIDGCANNPQSLSTIKIGDSLRILSVLVLMGFY